MASRSAGRIALMAIHVEFAEAILKGEKRVEFRKRPLRPEVTHVVMYATKPVGATLGVFSVQRQVTGSPRELWARFASVGGISRGRFFEYFAGHDMGTAIEVEGVVPFDPPVSLTAFVGSGRPPQSFVYLNDDQADRVLPLVS